MALSHTKIAVSSKVPLRLDMDAGFRSRGTELKIAGYAPSSCPPQLLNSQPLNFFMAAANDLRKGQAIKYNGNTAIVLDVQHRTPGNLRAFVQAIIRYINTGKSADVRFGSTDKIELVDINRTTLEFSYKDNNGYHFMDPESYDTVTLQDSLLGDAKDYLVENLPVQVLYAEGKAVQVELPSSVQLKVIEAPEGLRGDTASNVTKPAVLETGKTVNVPLFIQEGETVKIDTRTGDYMGRA
jgi:elongation factor P